MLRLNLGCGQYRAPLGWINVDHPSTEFDPSITAEVYCDIVDLPFKDSVADQVYMGHIIEHLSNEDLATALYEVERILTPGGTCMIVSPDMDRIDAMEDVPDWLNDAMKVTNEGRDGEHHKWVPTASKVLSLLEDEYAWDAKEVDLAEIAKLGSIWPVTAWTEWQFAIEARP